MKRPVDGAAEGAELRFWRLVTSARLRNLIFGVVVALFAAGYLQSCASSPAKVATVAGHTLAETSATYRRANAVAVEGCTRSNAPFPTQVCQAWADFSAWAVPTLDGLEGAYLAGTNPSGPDWERLLSELAELGAQLLALAFPADGGA